MTPDLASVDVVSKRINAFLRRSQSGGHKGALEIIDDVFDIIEVVGMLQGLIPRGPFLICIPHMHYAYSHIPFI